MLHQYLTIAFLLIIVFNDIYSFTLKSQSINKFNINLKDNKINKYSKFTKLNSFSSFQLADLNPETLNAIGDLSESDEAVEAINQVGPAVEILKNVVDTPVILFVPIAAGLLVAFGVGFAIYSWAQGRE